MLWLWGLLVFGLIFLAIVIRHCSCPSPDNEAVGGELGFGTPEDQPQLGQPKNSTVKKKE
jgi:hypothetical protein